MTKKGKILIFPGVQQPTERKSPTAGSIADKIEAIGREKQAMAARHASGQAEPRMPEFGVVFASDNRTITIKWIGEPMLAADVPVYLSWGKRKFLAPLMDSGELSWDNPNEKTQFVVVRASRYPDEKFFFTGTFGGFVTELYVHGQATLLK